ncbi:hypothetical protein ISCGN_003993 [Ixodes scapularis]
MTARPPQFDETTGSWNTYKVRLEAYFEGHSTEEPKRRALLVAALSDSVVKVLLGRCHPKKVNELSYEDVVKHLEEYYAPQVNEIAASYNFFMRNQEDGESVQAFVTEARRLAEDCNFGEMLHRMTRDRLVCGLRDDNVRRHLLTRRTLTLEEAEDFAIASEKAAESSRRMKKQEASVEEGAHLVQSGSYPKNRPKPGNKTGDSRGPCGRVLEKVYDESGRCMPPGKKLKQGSIRRPQRLVWDISPELEGEIAGALANAQKNNEDLDLYVRDHDSWGKGVIKKCKVSPDAFIQMALQLTYYKENKKFVQTYEASMTRLYLNGRTETVRSCTLEAVDFVKAMVENSVSNEEKIRLLRRAANKHQMLYRDAMSGKGVDRHLFALFVACKGLKYESEFLTNAIMRPWTLSTSQTPHTQLDYSPDADLEVFTNKICPGGGFGPVSDDGYGVSYIIPNNSKIFFHVSSKKSCPNTNSERFVKTLDESMNEMKALFSF